MRSTLLRNINSISLKTSGLTLVAGLGLLLQSCSKDSALDVPVAPKTVLEMAAEHEDLTLFVEAASLSNASYYMNPGVAYTLLAPNDSSFQAYLTSEGVSNVKQLRDKLGAANFDIFIRYHILERMVAIEQISSAYVVTFAELASGERLHCYMARDDLEININGQMARVTDPNILSPGGAIHKIAGVLKPLSLKGLVEVNPNFSKLSSLINHTSPLVDAELDGNDEDHTLFAPTDGAFNLFLNFYGYSDLNTLFGLASKEDMADALRYHIVEGKFRAEDFQNAHYSTLLDGASLHVAKDNNGSIVITDDKGVAFVKIINTNLVGINGIMHTVDKVLEYR